MPEKIALLWPFKYKDFEDTFEVQIKWIAKALQSCGYTVHKPYDFQCDIEGAQDPPWNEDWQAGLLPPSAHFDTIIYSHSDVAEIKNRERHGRPGNGLIDFPPPTINTDKTWTFKGCAPPSPLSATLDPLGYGSYSSITYEKPPFESVRDQEWIEFYDTKVKKWIKNNESKWGENVFEEKIIDEEDYYLILGQCPQDAVLVRQDFGGFFEKIYHIVDELLKIDKRKIIIKLHPYTNGQVAINARKYDVEPQYKNSVNPFVYPVPTPPGTKYRDGVDIAAPLKRYLEDLDKRVKVYTGFESIHSFLPKAKCVFVGNSGCGFDVMMHDTPMISFCQPEYHWVTYDLRKRCDIRRAVDIGSWFEQDKAKKFLYWYSEKYCFYDLETAKRRVKELLGE